MDGWVLEQLETFLQRWSTGQGSLCRRCCAASAECHLLFMETGRLCWVFFFTSGIFRVWYGMVR